MGVKVTIISWLLAERRRFQDRAGAPTLNDVRGRGVASAEVRKYMQGSGWELSTPTTDSYDTRPVWDRGAPTWEHADHMAIVFERGHDEFVISSLASREGRSSWAVLDDCAYYAGWQEISCPESGEVIAQRRGASLVPAICCVRMSHYGVCPLGTKGCTDPHEEP